MRVARGWFLQGILAVVVCGTLLAAIQFVSPDLVDVDGYYHIKMAALIRDHGLPLHFPWLKFTLLDEAGYTDHHLLQHLLQIPFTYLGDLRLAAKWSAVSFATFAFVMFTFLCWRYGIRYPLLWGVVLFASSPAFLFRMSMPRGQSLSLGLQLIAFHFLLRRRPMALAVVAAIFVWTYNGFLILLPLTLCGMVAHWVVARRIEYPLLVGVVSGISAGLVVHPYFPRDVFFLWSHIAPKLLTNDYTTSVGTEWYPYSSWLLLLNAPLALTAYVGALFLTNREEWLQDAPRLFWCLVSTLYLILFLKSRRFVEYFPPSAVLLLAFTVRGWLENITVARILQDKLRLAAAIASGVALLVALHYAITNVCEEIASSPATSNYQGGAEWLAAHTPAGSTIFHTDWDDFPMLFYFNTHNTYLVGLDPDFMRLKNPQLFHSWQAITQGRVRAPEDTILKEFGCEYVFSDNLHGDFLAVADHSPRMQKVYEDIDVTIYRVLASQDARQ